MKVKRTTSTAITLLFAFIATAAVLVAEPEKAAAPDTIKDKVSITLGQKFHLKFKLEGDRLLEPTTYKGTDDDKDTVAVSLYVTDSTPVRVSGVPTRPYIVVSNHFARTLHFRAMARLKGSKEFFEIGDLLEPAPPGENSQWCWASGSLVEEVVLYQFTFSEKSSK